VKTWCEHNICINGDHWVLTPHGGGPMGEGNRSVCTDEIFCPICGAKRPAEPKKLWEKMRNHISLKDSERKFLAQTAKDEFLRVVDEWNENKGFGVIVDVLKERIREM